MVIYSGDITNIAKVSAGNVSVIGSIEQSNFDVSDILGSVEVSNISSVDTSNILGSVEVSSIRNALPAGTNVVGSVLAKITEGTISAGSGTVLYSGPVTNVADVTSGRLATQTVGSVEFSNSSLSVTQGTTPWTTEGSAIQKGTWNIGTLTTVTNDVGVTQSTDPWIVLGSVE